jgi:hypothetical protein
MERKPAGRKHSVPPVPHEAITHPVDPEPEPPAAAAPTGLHPTPQGYKVWQLIAVNKSNQRLIFSDDGEHWFNFDGTVFA